MLVLCYQIKWLQQLGEKVSLTLIYQLLSLGEISSGCVCSLGSFESLLHQSGVCCD